MRFDTDTRVESEASGDGSGSATPELDPSGQGGPVQASPAGPLTSVPYQLDGTDGTVSCFQATSGAPTGSFVVQVSSAAPVPDGMTVGVDLVASDGSRHDQAVTIPAQPDQGDVAVVVPGSASTDGTAPYLDCTITAIQKGERVILTGS
jgi:hypothetical protein